MSNTPEGHSSEMSDYIEDLQKQIAELEDALRNLYEAGYWEIENMPTKDQIALWENAKQALGGRG